MSTEITEYSKTEAALADLRERYATTQFDVSTTGGMNSAKAARAEIRGYRVDLEKMRKKIKAPALERCNLIDAEAKRITIELVKLEAPIEQLISAEELRKDEERREVERQAKERSEKLAAEIETIKRIPLDYIGKGSGFIAMAIQGLQALDLAPFAPTHDAMAGAEKKASLDTLWRMHADAVKREEGEAALKLERERLEAQAKAQAAKQAEEDRIARQAREAADKEAQAKRDQEAIQARAQAAQKEAERQEAADAERKILEAQRLELEAAKKAEADRLAAERKAQADRELEIRNQRAALDKRLADEAATKLTEELASITLLQAAEDAYKYLARSGQSHIPEAKKLKAAIDRETQRSAAA